MSTEKAPTSEYPAKTSAFKTLRDKIYIHEFPSYGNKIFYSLGFLALTSLILLVLTGSIMACMGPTWWLTSVWGIHVRSIHEWSVQAFMAILVCHFLVGLSTSAFKPPRRMVWVFGAVIFCLALIQTEFGFALRGDFSSQYRIISGADFWNGAHLGWFINPENISQDFAIHIAIIPIIILGLFVLHYLLEHTYGIAKPYRKDVAYQIVPANHIPMYVRGGALVVLVLAMAWLFPSPFVAPETIRGVATQDPTLVAQTLLQEFDHTSDTATYLDSIDPYTYDTRQVYVVVPYTLASTSSDAITIFQTESPDQQQSDIAQAHAYFDATTTATVATGATDAVSAQQHTFAHNPVIAIINSLVPLAQSGVYESILNQESPNTNYTYTTRFLTDTGVLDAEAAAVHITTAEWGMVREETGSLAKLPPGAWWFAPIGILNSTVLAGDDNGDRDAAAILGFVMLVFILFPYIPYLNRLPEYLPFAKWIWK